MLPIVSGLGIMSISKTRTRNRTVEVSFSRIDTCLPSYFQGCSSPYVQVAVDGSTTLRDVISGIKDAVHADDVSNGDEIAHIDEEVLKKAADDLYEGQDLDKLFDSSLDETPDDDDMPFESVYAYFMITVEK